MFGGAFLQWIPQTSYGPPANESVAYEEMHSFLQTLMDEHKAITSELGELRKLCFPLKIVVWTRKQMESWGIFSDCLMKTPLLIIEKKRKAFFPFWKND